jgi:hypothetical protein
MYPLASFPEVREFAAMLERIRTSETWSGIHFHGYAAAGADTDSTQLFFYRYRDEVALGFSPEEWQHLRGLLTAALTSPQLRSFWEELELVYGEL